MFRVSPALHLFHYFGLLNNHTPRGGNSLSRGSSWESIWFEPGTPRHFSPSAATKPKAHVALHLSWEKQDFLARSWLLQAPEYDFLETGQLVFLEPSETLWPPLCDIALGRMLQSYKICSNMCFLKGLLWHIDHDELNKDSRSHSWLFLHNTGDWVKC